MPKLELPPAATLTKMEGLPPRVKIEKLASDPQQPDSKAFRLSPVKAETEPFFFSTPLPVLERPTSSSPDAVSEKNPGPVIHETQLALNKDAAPMHSIQALRVVANFFRSGILSTAQKVLACGVLNNEFGFVNKAAMVYFCLTLDTNNVKLLVSKCFEMGEGNA